MLSAGGIPRRRDAQLQFFIFWSPIGEISRENGVCLMFVE
jgi:hypothetical protein